MHDNHEIKEVENYKYLGSKIVTNRKYSEIAERIIKCAGKVYQLVRDILWK
jgi:HEPN domain-containing protein